MQNLISKFEMNIILAAYRVRGCSSSIGRTSSIIHRHFAHCASSSFQRSSHHLRIAKLMCAFIRTYCQHQLLLSPIPLLDGTGSGRGGPECSRCFMSACFIQASSASVSGVREWPAFRCDQTVFFIQKYGFGSRCKMTKLSKESRVPDAQEVHTTLLIILPFTQNSNSYR